MTDVDNQTDIPPLAEPDTTGYDEEQVTMNKPEQIYDYDLPVDVHGKATRIRIFSIRRPHMRAFHFAWFSFFLAFFGWFALAPLQKGISRLEPNSFLQDSNRYKYQNIVSVAGTVLMRFTIGPICDRFGPRIAQSALLGVFSLPVFLVSTVRTYAQWTAARFFIGFIGAAFVVTQFWTSIMFSGNIVGAANATSAGWGNLGGGVTQAVMPLINKAMRAAVGVNSKPAAEQDAAKDKAWRLAMIFPGVALIITAIALFTLTDDLPQGQYGDLHKAGTKEKTNPFMAFGRAATNWRSWILFTLYGCCFGVELIMNSNLASYFSSDGDEAFDLDEGLAGLIASLFGLMNLFARSLGGLFSDLLASKFGMRGRLWAFFMLQLTEGLCFVAFSRIRVLGGAIPMIVCFSTFVQMSEGATFGIVPFVDPLVTGAVSGIVGAGGNAGAMIGGFLLKPNTKNGLSDGFLIIGCIVVGSAFLIPLLWWPEYGSMFLAPRSAPGKIIEDDDEPEEVIDDDQDMHDDGQPTELVS